MSASDDCDGFVESTCITRVSIVAIATAAGMKILVYLRNRAFEQFGRHDKCGHSSNRDIVITLL